MKVRKIPDSFEDHEHYLHVMEPLFLNEVASIIKSSKRTVDVPQDQIESVKSKKELKWTSVLMREDIKEEERFLQVKLLDRMPSGQMMVTEGLPTPSQTALKTIKENDLLIISKVDILTGQNDIKNKLTPEWIINSLNSGQALLAYVQEKARKGIMYLQLIIEGEASKQFFKDTKPCMHIYCYYVESLSTSVREFRTLRMSEFCGAFSNQITRP